MTTIIFSNKEFELLYSTVGLHSDVLPSVEKVVASGLAIDLGKSEWEEISEIVAVEFSHVETDSEGRELDRLFAKIEKSLGNL